MAATGDQSTAAIEPDADRRGQGAGGLLVIKKTERLAALGLLAFGAKAVEGNPAAQEGFDASDVHLEHARPGFDGGRGDTPEAGIDGEARAKFGADGNIEGGLVFGIESFVENRAHGDASVVNRGSLVDVGEVSGGESDFEAVLFGLNAAPFLITDGAAGENRGWFAANAWLEGEEFAGDECVQSADAFEGNLRSDESEGGGGFREVLELRLESYGGADVLVRGVRGDGVKDSDVITEVANSCLPWAKSPGIAEIDGQRFAGSTGGAFVWEKLKAGIGLRRISGGSEVVVGHPPMEEGFDAGDIDR